MSKGDDQVWFAHAYGKSGKESRMTNTQPPDLDTLKAELKWCLANNRERPRTESTLMWALSLVEEIESERKVIEEAEREQTT